MLIRRLAAGAGLVLALALAACETGPAPATPTAPPVPATAVATASLVPPTATTTPLPPSPTLLPAPPTLTVPPPSPTPLALPFEAGLDQVGLVDRYTQALPLVNTAAPDARLSRVQMTLGPGLVPQVQFDFYAAGSQTVYHVLFGPKDTPPVRQEPEATSVPTFSVLPWDRNPRWPLLVAEAARQAQLTPAPPGRWLFQLTTQPGGPDWALALTRTDRFALRDGQVTALAPDSGRPAETPVPAPAGEDLPFGWVLNNAAIDRYYRAAARLVTPQVADATLRSVELRLGDPADAGEAAVLYHFYATRQQKEYLAIFDTGGRRDVTPMPATPGAAPYRESTLPWKQAPAWPGLVQVAAQALGPSPARQVTMHLSASAADPGAWLLAATVGYHFVLAGEMVTRAEQ